MIPYRITIESTVEPVSVDELKDHDKIQTGDEDHLIALYITAARQLAENRTGRQLCPATLECKLEEFPADEIKIPLSPLMDTSLLAITYLDTSGTVQILGSTIYEIDVVNDPPRIRLAYNNTWPDVQDSRYPITITFRAGYPRSTVIGESMVPEAIREWIRMRATGMYNQRGSLTDMPSLSEIPRDHLDGLLDPYIIKGVI